MLCFDITLKKTGYPFHYMAKLREKFSVDEWKNCCTSMCKDCAIAKKYKKEYGKKKGEKKLKEDKEKVTG